jgi:hypothetical protein
MTNLTIVLYKQQQQQQQQQQQKQARFFTRLYHQLLYFQSNLI